MDKEQRDKIRESLKDQAKVLIADSKKIPVPDDRIQEFYRRRVKHGTIGIPYEADEEDIRRAKERGNGYGLWWGEK